MPIKPYLINSPDERALEILYLKHEVAHNYPGADGGVGLTAGALAHVFWPPKVDMQKAQDALNVLESRGLLAQERLGVYKLTEGGLDVVKRLFGDFTMYGDFLEGAECYFDNLCAERKGGEWRLL